MRKRKSEKKRENTKEKEKLALGLNLLLGPPKGFSARPGYSSIAHAPAAWWTPRVSHSTSFLLCCALGPIGRILPFLVARAVETAARNSRESGHGIPQPGESLRLRPTRAGVV
jgi:hypothetical protein